MNVTRNPVGSQEMGIPIRVKRAVHKETMRNLIRRRSHNRIGKIHTMKMERKLLREQEGLIRSSSLSGCFPFSISSSTFLSFTPTSKLYSKADLTCIIVCEHKYLGKR